MKITKAVIPVAGKGTRFLPATKEIPKEMIPILDRPMIHYAVEEAVKSGIEKVIFVTSSGKQAIEDYFDRNFELENFLKKNNKLDLLAKVRSVSDIIEVTSVRQKEQLGLGHAIHCAKDLISNENFAVILGDDLVVSEVPVTKQLIDISNQNNMSPVIGVMEIDPSQSDKYGIIRGEFIDELQKTLKMFEMVEKPKPSEAPSRLATPGRYILTPRIFEYLSQIPRGVGGEYQLTDAINRQAQDEDVFAHIFVGDRFDTGTVEGYLNAVVEFGLRSPVYSAVMRTILAEKIKQYNIGL